MREIDAARHDRVHCLHEIATLRNSGDHEVPIGKNGDRPNRPVCHWNKETWRLRIVRIKASKQDPVTLYGHDPHGTLTIYGYTRRAVSPGGHRAQ